MKEAKGREKRTGLTISVTAEERERIFRLARSNGRPVVREIMILVDAALANAERRAS